jgi:hypothetical protein
MLGKKEQCTSLIATENEPFSEEIIKSLITAGFDPLKPNSQKLLPFHFAKNVKVFEALTPPPIDRRCFLLTLAK